MHASHTPQGPGGLHGAGDAGLKVLQYSLYYVHPRGLVELQGAGDAGTLLLAYYSLCTTLHCQTNNAHQMHKCIGPGVWPKLTYDEGKVDAVVLVRFALLLCPDVAAEQLLEVYELTYLCERFSQCYAVSASTRITSEPYMMRVCGKLLYGSEVLQTASRDRVGGPPSVSAPLLQEMQALYYSLTTHEIV